jgi:hypothetical protein
MNIFQKAGRKGATLPTRRKKKVKPTVWEINGLSITPLEQPKGVL